MDEAKATKGKIKNAAAQRRKEGKFLPIDKLNKPKLLKKTLGPMIKSDKNAEINSHQEQLNFLNYF